jgi:hypothetical protein
MAKVLKWWWPWHFHWPFLWITTVAYTDFKLWQL